jgi:glycosyltransferase involved in cell wall biosynthesis
VNQGTADLLEQWGTPREKLFIIPSFYLDREVLLRFAQQTSRFTPNRSEATGSGQATKPRKEPEAPRGKHYDVVCCGRLVANKGLKNVLRALALLPKRTLLIIGDGPLRGRIEALARKLGVAERVTFAGWLDSREEVYRALRSAKIFVMNSGSEGGPRAALEAMALGLPVVTTAVGVMPDILSEGATRNGYLTSGTPEDLREKLEKLLEYPSLRERLGLEARRTVEKFEKVRLIRDYAEFLKRRALPLKV